MYIHAYAYTYIDSQYMHACIHTIMVSEQTCTPKKYIHTYVTNIFTYIPTDIHAHIRIGAANRHFQFLGQEHTGIHMYVCMYVCMLNAEAVGLYTVSLYIVSLYTVSLYIISLYIISLYTVSLYTVSLYIVNLYIVSLYTISLYTFSISPLVADCELIYHQIGYVYMHTYVHTHIHTCNRRTFTSYAESMCTYTHVHIHICTNTHMYAYTLAVGKQTGTFC